MSNRTRRLRSRRAISRSVKAINACVELLEDRTLFAFGLTTTTNSFIVDTGANVTFAVKRVTAGNGAVGDLISMKYNGTELSAPFASTSRFSHYESGLGSGTTVTAATIGNAIVVACSDLAGTGVIQYYIAKNGENNIYMAQYAPGPNSPSPGEMRFITYLNWAVFTNHPNESDTSAIHGTAQTAIESTDVFRDPVDGWTHSKYYGEYRFMDDPGYWGATGTSGGNGFGAFMFAGNRETSSGGPFYKDIDFQSTGAAVELYNYTFSGHSQTENFRPGLKGPFAIQFTNGSAPTPVDYSFIDGLPLTGLTPASGRGAVSGVASGAAAGLEVTVGLSNASFQYSAHPDNAGNYTISGVMPGTYTQTLYQGELAIATKSVTVSAGSTTSSNIASTFVTPNSIWRIGKWDGTPIGFLNADKIQVMHPSDPRMSPWVNQNFVVGTNTDADFLMAQFKDAALNSTQTITFNLTAQQVQAMQLRIGITTAQGGGRPIISTNGGSFSSAPAISPQPSTRNITLGNWRGNNFLYTYNISAAALHAGTNNIRIQVASGSGGAQFLSPADVYDVIELNPTIPAAPTGLVAQSISDHEIDLVTWNPSPGATSYNVKRSATSGGPYTTIATGVTTTSYQDPTLNSGTNYYYVVSAVNGAGEGLNSSQASAQTRPAAPTGLTATTVSTSEIDLTWDATFGATSYNLMRADVSGGPYLTIATGLASPSFNDTTLSSGTAYYYVVVANDSGGPSLASAEATATTQSAAPENLSASASSANQIDLSWDASFGAASYTIKRSDSSGGPYVDVGTSTAPSFSDTTVDPSHRYYYVVSASNAGGEGPDSSEAVATTPPVPNAGDDQTVDEGQLVNFDGSGSQGTGLSYSWDFGDGGTFTSSSPTASHTYGDNGQYSVTLTVTDTFGQSVSDTADVTVNNVAPTINSTSNDGPVDEASPVNVSISATDPAGANDPLTYYFDFDNDGIYEVSGLSPSASHTFDDNGTYTVNVRVTDGDGGETISSTLVTVNNVAPTLAISGPAGGVTGQPLNYTFTSTDASPVDQAGSFTYSIDWNGDGTIDQTVVGGLSIQVPHAYLATGTYTIKATSTDKDGGISTLATKSASIVAISTVQDTLDPSKTMLVIGGTNDSDIITVLPGGSGKLIVSIIGLSCPIQWTAMNVNAPTGRIVIYGLGGSDVISILGVNNVSWLYGDDGNDLLNLGNGGGIAFGGNGNDILTGGNGRDVLVGGRGGDVLLGNSGDDILISAYTRYDSRAGYTPAGGFPTFAQPEVNHEQAWGAISAEWNSTRNYTTRIANISGTGSGASFAARLNGSYFLKTEGTFATGQTIFDDSASDEVDILTGSAGDDWFLANTGNSGLENGVIDLILGASGSEVKSDLDVT